MIKRSQKTNTDLRSEATSREKWLATVAAQMSLWFDDLGFSLPPFELKTGFPSAGRRSPKTTESWKDGDTGAFVIFVRPDREDATEIAAAIAFQMCRIAVEDSDTHGHLFRHLAISIGLRGSKNETPPGKLFTELFDPVLESAGPVPASDINPPSDPNKKAQRSRLLKVSCSECGYVARVSRKWLDGVGAPHCPQHGAMKVDD